MGKLITPEREVLKSCMNRLDWWERVGAVVWYDRNNSGGAVRNTFTGTWIKQHRPGTPDITAYVKYGEICAVYFVECKRVGAKQSPAQLEFLLKFKDLTNIYYDVVTDPKQIDERIELITGYSQRLLDSMPTHL